MCSIDSAPAAAGADGAHKRSHRGESLRQSKRLAAGGQTADNVDTSIVVGGVEELLEFVRSSVLAGPRPFSFAFHEQSLR